MDSLGHEWSMNCLYMRAFNVMPWMSCDLAMLFKRCYL